jgi:murein L,D-transpeptidase YafK
VVPLARRKTFYPPGTLRGDQVDVWPKKRRLHGDCSSSGCYAMTDEQMGEIYSLARDSLLGGRTAFQIQAYPFRLTPANLARHRTSSSIPWN